LPISHSSGIVVRVRGRLNGSLREEDLVQDVRRLDLDAVLGQRDLADEDRAGLREHALLAGRQTALAVSAPQIAHDLRYLQRGTGRQLLDIGLVTPRPVGGLLRVRGPQHVEDLVEALRADDFPDADHLDVLGWNLDREVTLLDSQHEVFLFDTADDASFHSFNECGPVVGVDNGLADTKTHRIETPFAVSSLTRRWGFPRQRIAMNALVNWYVIDYSTASRARGADKPAINEARVAH